MNNTLAPLLQHLERSETLVRATILTHSGSTPRSAGSCMLLAAQGPDHMRILAGTVGGGLVEAQVMAAAVAVLATGAPRLENFELTGELAAGADMICGGRLRVFLERLGPQDLPLWRGLAHALALGQTGLRLASLEPLPPASPSNANAPAGASLLLPDGTLLGAPLPPELVQAARSAASGLAAPSTFDHAGRAYALEPWTADSPLAIFGAGHVSRPTAQIAALCGFRVTVLDDRPDFASVERFPQARTVVLPSFDNCLAELPQSPQSAIVIVTRGHVHDAEVLAQALRTQAGYVGMIGSRRKREAVYNRLRAQGFTDDDLLRVHCPIGLSIDAETPEEIAVSINAELIQWRAKARE